MQNSEKNAEGGVTDQCKAGKFILGITGGVDSSKNRILAILKEDYGFYVIQADQVAKDLMQPEMESYLVVVGYLGPSIFLEDKSLDRAAMVEIIFYDSKKRRGVDERAHPLVWEAAMEEAMAAKEDRVVIEAVIPSKEFRDKYSEMWYVCISGENRIKHLEENRGYMAERTPATMENQVSEETFRAFSNAVIDNNGTLEGARAQIQALLEYILQAKDCKNMRMASIASGSSRNCIYIGSGDTHIPVDVGISNKRIQQGFNEIGLSGNDVNGILITHGHSDHIKGLGILSRKYHVPVYDIREISDEITSSGSLGEFDKDLLTPICPDVDFTSGDLNVRPFKIDHDTASLVAYRMSCGDKSVAVATDTGHFDQYIIDDLQGLDAPLPESNHNVRMLKTGLYPYYLKRRILGDHGYLSNENTGRLLNCVLHDKPEKVFLGHLSKGNNCEELAYETVHLEIGERGCPYGASDSSISVAGKDHMSEIVYLQVKGKAPAFPF